MQPTDINPTPTTIQTLDWPTVQLAGLKAYARGTLTAQHNLGCVYSTVWDGKTYTCAIGAALTPDTIRQVHENRANTVSLGAIVGMVHTKDYATYTTLSGLQLAHDHWSKRQTPEAKAAFLAKLCSNLPPAEFDNIGRQVLSKAYMQPHTLAAYALDKLTAPHGEGCVYLNPHTGRKCAIGAGLAPSILARNPNGAVTELRFLFGFTSEPDRIWLQELQTRHDMWNRLVHAHAPACEESLCKQRFLDYLCDD